MDVDYSFVDKFVESKHGDFWSGKKKVAFNTPMFARESIHLGGKRIRSD